MSRRHDTLPDGFDRADTTPGMPTPTLETTSPPVVPEQAPAVDAILDGMGGRAPIYKKRVPESQGLSGAVYDATVVPRKGHDAGAQPAAVVVDITDPGRPPVITAPLDSTVPRHLAAPPDAALTTIPGLPSSRTSLRSVRNVALALLAIGATVAAAIVVVPSSTSTRRANTTDASASGAVVGVASGASAATGASSPAAIATSNASGVSSASSVSTLLQPQGPANLPPTVGSIAESAVSQPAASHAPLPSPVGTAKRETTPRTPHAHGQATTQPNGPSAAPTTIPSPPSPALPSSPPPTSSALQFHSPIQ